MAPWSERELIEKIRTASQGFSTGLIKSIGDDCCEVTSPGSFLISTDSLVDGVHFDRSFHPANLLGRKSIAVNLSDIAAMGGNPRFVLLSLCLPLNLEWCWISSWLDGVLEILLEHNCILVGGDTVKAQELVLGVTVLGEAPETGSLYRDTAAVGDSIWVSGPLGSAAAGLKILQKKKENPEIFGDKKPQQWPALLAAHLNPRPRVSLGRELAACGMVSAMQDISDGVATDLAHICKASAVSASIRSQALPFLPELETAAEFLRVPLQDLMLRSGEDYELLFTVKKGAESAFEKLICTKHQQISKIGEIGCGAGVILLGDEGDVDITFQGYEH